MKLKASVVISVLAAAAGGAAVRGCSAPPTALALSAGRPTSPAIPDPPPRFRSHVAQPIVVYVAGAVGHSGVYRLAPASRAVDAVRIAGGATTDADLVRVNLAEPLADGEEVVVPSKSAPDAAYDVASGPPRHSHKHKRRHRAKHGHHRRATAVAASDGDASSGTASASEPQGVVNVNSADENELETLPGVGSALAQRIVAFRELNGAFASADDLLDVAGMTQSKLDEIEPYIAVP